MTNVLLLLALPQNFRNFYYTEVSRRYPQAHFIQVDHVSKVDPHLATMDVLVTFGPHLLDRAGNNVQKAAELAGVHRSTLYEKLAALGVPYDHDGAPVAK